MSRRPRRHVPRAASSAPPRSGIVAWAALAVSIAALVIAGTGLAGATAGHPARQSARGKGAAKSGTVVHLGADGRIPARYLPRPIPAADIPRVANATNAKKLGGQTATQLTGSCSPTTVDLGTWCLMAAPYPLTNADIGKNNYFWASQKCVSLGGYLPTAGQLIGAAARVKLESTIDDSPLTATVEQDPSRGLQDQREMSATLVTTAGGSDSAGSEGVTVGSTGNPDEGQPNPTPQPAVPQPQTLQYVTVYDNHDKGGFAGSEPVSQPENFRCAFEKVPGAAGKSNN
jgi:hypothetical protein